MLLQKMKSMPFPGDVCQALSGFGLEGEFSLENCFLVGELLSSFWMIKRYLLIEQSSVTTKKGKLTVAFITFNLPLTKHELFSSSIL